MEKKKICILGGSGFVGRNLIRLLAKSHCQLRVLTRSPQQANLLALPGVEYIKADIHELSELQKHFRDIDAVINLVGILNEKGDAGEGFYQAHVELTQNVVRACQDNDITRLLHMSALNANREESESYYLKSKSEAEHHVFSATGIDVTVFRPSVIFGHDDSFINRFAQLLKQIPLVFPLACAQARFAPVYVEDVAQAFARSLKMPETYGQAYNLCGPKIYKLEEIVIYIKDQLKLKRMIVPLGNRLSRYQAELMEFVPGKPFSRDNYRSLQLDSICPESNNTLATVFDIQPTALEEIVPAYLLKKKNK